MSLWVEKMKRSKSLVFLSLKFTLGLGCRPRSKVVSKYDKPAPSHQVQALQIGDWSGMVITSGWQSYSASKSTVIFRWCENYSRWISAVAFRSLFLLVYVSQFAQNGLHVENRGMNGYSNVCFIVLIRSAPMPIRILLPYVPPQCWFFKPQSLRRHPIRAR